MVRNGPSPLDDSIQKWLASWGFKGNPFATWEASQEIELSKYFVERSFYDQLRTSVSPTLIFAPRGGGKSAMRIMLESECQPAQYDSSFFAIPFVDFSPLVEKYSETGVCTLKDFLPPIIDETIINLFLSLVEQRLNGLGIPSNALSQLRFWVERYKPQYLSPYFLPQFLKKLFPRANLHELRTWSELIRNNKHKAKDQPKLNTVNSLWNQLTKVASIPFPFAMNSSLEVMNSLVMFVLDFLAENYVPCKAIYLLVDGIDEYDLTQNNPKASASILKPLLGNTRLLEIPNFAVKFFLPVEQREALESIPRLDRLTGEVHTLTWEWSDDNLIDTDDLRTLLRRRINAFNDLGMKTLDELCAPNLRHLLEGYLLKESRNSPRNLIRLGNLLFLEHCQRKPQPESRLAYEEWERAVQRFLSTELESPAEDKTSLRLDPITHRVFVGDQEIHPPLAELEFKLLKFLYQNSGQVCSRHDIMTAVYTDPDDSPLTRQDKISLITDEALGNLVYRLRKKLSNVSTIEYLKTFPRQGYLLDPTST